ncbi:hypothetical protein VB618_18720 [Microvirga sp. CF3062]|uniref:hypothetical protein n=1 Tax=Microvirga sp. CF3062 TaxID=3110182 RepID=UPI002E784EA9|nr:hypothetical protein [Microvirga sp. CF3062]MEE1658236.1 hypothetical protein [Microvirga sp. CF3062]
MSSKFEEAFYRNKRAALLSSLATIAVSALAIRIPSSTQILGVQIGSEISNFWAAIGVLIVCAYLNGSYYLYYFSEIPSWARDPEQGIKQAEAVREALREMKEKAETEVAKISEAQTLYRKYWDELSKYSQSPIPDGIVDSVQSKIANSISGRRGVIQVAAFNQLSSAIHEINGLQHVSKLNWEKMSEQIVDTAATVVVRGVGQQVDAFLAQLHKRNEEIVSDIDKTLSDLRELEELRRASVEREIVSLEDVPKDILLAGSYVFSRKCSVSISTSILLLICYDLFRRNIDIRNAAASLYDPLGLYSKLPQGRLYERPIHPLLGLHRHPDHRGGFQPLVGHASAARAAAGCPGCRALPQG